MQHLAEVAHYASTVCLSRAASPSQALEDCTEVTVCYTALPVSCHQDRLNTDCWLWPCPARESGVPVGLPKLQLPHPRALWSAETMHAIAGLQSNNQTVHYKANTRKQGQASQQFQQQRRQRETAAQDAQQQKIYTLGMCALSGPGGMRKEKHQDVTTRMHLRTCAPVCTASQ